MKIVGVSSCPVGIAHSFMCAENMETAAKQLGAEVKIEIQGQMLENKLKDAEIEASDLIMLSTYGGLSGKDRFEGYEDKTVHLDSRKAVDDVDYIVGVIKDFFKL